MADERDILAEAANTATGRRKDRAGRQNVTTDSKQFKALNDEMGVLKRSVKDVRTEVQGLIKDANQAMGAVRGMAGAATGQSTMAGGTPRPVTTGVNTSPPVGGGGGAARPPGGGAGINTGGNFGGMRGYVGGMSGGMANRLIGGYIAGQVAGQIVGGIDARIDRGAQYAASADRLGIVLQQQYGLSQMGVMQQMRQPLTNYRLGAGGINDMLAFQSSTGVNAGTLASTVEGLRALNGYAKSTQGVLQDQRSLMDPQVANRMFMMLGTNAYTMGGGVNDPIKMRQQIVRSMGLNNEDVLRSAKLPGSVTRARMTDAGIPVEVQDEILKYAQANRTFQEKGGQGMYDPSKKADRKRMGIEENFATQIEETERLRGAREEQFMERQIDNLASMEKNTQQMVELLGSIEDKLSGLVGARASSRGWQRIGGRLLQIGGAAAMFAPVPGARIVGAGAMVAGGALASGDPQNPDSEGGGISSPSISTNSGNDGNIHVPFGYGNQKVSLTDLKSKSTFQGMNPKMRDRLLAMMRASGGRVGIGQGLRDPKQQEAMFRDRYRPDPNGDVSWNGQKWKRVKGAPAAPPGRSMHEIGLAADLVGDLDWVQANAGRFGLKTFANVNNEPWHVQPTELPNSRRKYEEGGAQWGTDGGFTEDTTWGEGTGSDNRDAPVEHLGDGGNYAASGLRSFAGMSIADIIDAMDEDGRNRLMSAAGFSRGTSTSPTKKSLQDTTTGSTVIGSGASIPSGRGALTGEQVAQIAFNAGFRGQDLINMVAIAKRESSWNPRAYNGNLNTGDQSYGLWQLNTLNKQGAGMMGDYVSQILKDLGYAPDFDLLFDPNINAKVAYRFYQDNGNTLRSWGGYKGKSNTYNTNVEEAAQIVTGMGLNNSGDPMPMDVARPYDVAPTQGRMGMQLPVSLSKPIHIDVRPEINFVGQPQHSDLDAIAHKVTALIEQGIREMEMRDA